MHYWKINLIQSLHDTWFVIGDAPLITVLFTVGVFLVTFKILKGFLSADSMREKLIETIVSFAVLVLFAVLVFLFCVFLISPTQIYQTQNITITNQSNTISAIQKQLDEKSPKLEGFIHRIMIADEAGTTNSLIFIDASISNLGETPSVAEEYGVAVNLSTNHLVKADEINFSDEYKLPFIHKNEPWLIDLKRRQLISEKTTQAIPMGELSRGWLAYRLQGIQLNQYHDTNVFFTFLDIDGKRSYATNGIWHGKLIEETNLDDLTMMIPGAENIFYPNPPEIRTNWLPPELPSDCSNVVVFLGSSGIIYSRLMAEISPEGTKFAIKDLPDFYLQNMDKIPAYSPHMENMWIKWTSAQQNYGSKIVDLPILPLVISNRFYVEVQIPFSNEKRKLVISREFDSELSKLPKNWDWNYSTNYNSTRGIFYYEIVNEFTNPVLQVFYTAPNEIHVFGIFIENTNQLLETFGGPPQLLTLNEKFISKKTGKEITSMREIKKELGTNSIGNLMTNLIYDLKFPESKTILKYPFNRNVGAFADWIKTNSESSP